MRIAHASNKIINLVFFCDALSLGIRYWKRGRRKKKNYMHNEQPLPTFARDSRTRCAHCLKTRLIKLKLHALAFFFLYIVEMCVPFYSLHTRICCDGRCPEKIYKQTNSKFYEVKKSNLILLPRIHLVFQMCRTHKL